LPFCSAGFLAHQINRGKRINSAGDIDKTDSLVIWVFLCAVKPQLITIDKISTCRYRLQKRHTDQHGKRQFCNA
jgi:hypothetical protein